MGLQGRSAMGIQLVTTVRTFPRCSVRLYPIMPPSGSKAPLRLLLPPFPSFLSIVPSLPVSLSSAAPGTPLSAYFTSVSLSNSRLFQQQNLMETNSVQGSIMGLFSYLWTEYFPLKDANDSLRDKLIKTPAKSRGKGSLKRSRSPPRTRLPPTPGPISTSPPSNEHF